MSSEGVTGSWTRLTVAAVGRLGDAKSMADRSRKKRPRDVNALTAAIVQEATGKVLVEESGKNPAAVALGWVGGKKGGKARVEKLTAERRREIAEKAAETRWSAREPNDQTPSWPSGAQRG